MRHLIETITEAYQHDVAVLEAHGWTIARKTNGMNGLIYRATSEDSRQLPLCIKVSMRDERNRSQREFGAMQAIQGAGMRGLAPFPLLLVEQPRGLPGDVVVMEWLEGESLEAPPSPDDWLVWYAILEAFSRLHSLMPETTRNRLYPAVISVRQPEEMLKVLLQRRARLPLYGELGAITADELDGALADVSRLVPVKWEQIPQLSLILCDANMNNIILKKNHVQLVDWANSGWGDAAFDIADMFAQPGFLDVPDDHRNWIRKTYRELSGDVNVIERIQTYEILMHVFWVMVMTEPLVGARKKRLGGTKENSLETYQDYQMTYWKRVQNLIG